MDKNDKKLWIDFLSTRSMEYKEKLIEKYIDLVKYVAGRLSIYFGQNVEYDDLVGYGVFGLIDAIDKFDLGKGVKFETYAALRIRGSIIDSIRKFDWVPRSLRQKQKDLQKVYNQLENEYGRPPTDQEMASKLNMSLTAYSKLLTKTSSASLISLEEYTEQNKYEFMDSMVNSIEEQPEGMLEKNEIIDMLAGYIDKLPEKEKMVISLYYYEELTLKEISVILNVSESRISQIHSKAILRLRSNMTQFYNIM